MKVIITKNAVKELLQADFPPLFMVTDVHDMASRGIITIVSLQKDIEIADKIATTLKNGLRVCRMGENMFESYRRKIFDELRTEGVGITINDDNLFIKGIGKYSVRRGQ